jgi:hypothetical protein
MKSKLRTITTLTLFAGCMSLLSACEPGEVVQDISIAFPFLDCLLCPCICNCCDLGGGCQKVCINEANTLDKCVELCELKAGSNAFGCSRQAC